MLFKIGVKFYILLLLQLQLLLLLLLLLQCISSPFPDLTWDRRTFDQLMEVLQYTQWQDTKGKQCSKQELKLENEGKFHKWNCFQYRTNIQQTLICGTYGSSTKFILGLRTAEAAAADCSKSWMTYCITCYWKLQLQTVPRAEWHTALRATEWSGKRRRGEQRLPRNRRRRAGKVNRYRWNGLVIRLEC